MSKESTKFAKDNKKYILEFGIKKVYEINKCYYSTQQGVHCNKQIYLKHETKCDSTLYHFK